MLNAKLMFFFLRAHFQKQFDFVKISSPLTAPKMRLLKMYTSIFGS